MGVIRLRAQIRRRRRNLAAGALVLAAGGATYGVAGPAPALALTLAAAIAWALTPLMARLARMLDAVVRPGGRSIHSRATPLGGGLAILVPVAAFASLTFAQGDKRMGGLLLAALLLATSGLHDDVHPLRARHRLGLQGLAGLALAVTGWTLPVLSLGGGLALDLGPWGPALLVLWVVSCVNAFNLIDGMDGLCSSLAVVAAAGGLLAGAHPLLCAVAAGGALGFLRHNAPSARVFLGDAGSQLLGLLAAAIALTLPREENLVMALGLVAYPAGDVAMAVVRRALRAKPLFVGDASHVHHKLLDLLGSPRRALAAVLAFAALEVAVAGLVGGAAALVAGIGLWALLLSLLVAAGRIRLPRMLHSRDSFRRLHALRAYVATLLDLADGRSEVTLALRRLAEDLDLVHLSCDRLGVVHARSRPPGPVASVQVPLRRGEARWVYVAATDDTAFDGELRSVVTELVRQAQARLLRLERAARLAATPVVPIPPPTPSEVGR